jgi:hypothetical protein
VAVCGNLVEDWRAWDKRMLADLPEHKAHARRALCRL